MIISHFSPYYTKYRLKCIYHLSVGMVTYHVGVLSLHSYPINLIICDYSLLYIYIQTDEFVPENLQQECKFGTVVTVWYVFEFGTVVTV
jgi:hypothetical protein